MQSCSELMKSGKINLIVRGMLLQFEPVVRVDLQQTSDHVLSGSLDHASPRLAAISPCLRFLRHPLPSGRSHA